MSRCLPLLLLSAFLASVEARCPAASPAAGRELTDQFGTRTVTRRRPTLLCTPAVRGTAYCGDGTLGAGEECEGANLAGATCTSLGYARGSLGCSPGCRYDTSGCSSAAFPATGQVTCWDADGAPTSRASYSTS